MLSATNIPSITDWITSITTVVLVCVTLYYAIINHFIMKFQNKIYELEKRPFFAFDDVIIQIYKSIDQTDLNKSGVQLGIRFKNVGKTIIKYNVEKIICSIDNKTLHMPNLINKGCFIYPGQTNDYLYDTFWGIKIDDPVINGLVEYEITYTSDGIKKYKTYRKLSVQVYTIDRKSVV